MLFGQFVGEWELDCTEHHADGTTRSYQGEWHFGWALEGRAIQDVWLYPPRSANGATAQRGEYGTTVRFYDPRIGAWRVFWAGPVLGVVRTFVARQVGDEIVLEGLREDGSRVRWIFSEIEPRSFRWRAVVSADDGATWTLVQEMAVRRR
jgi:hypothetical protein